HSHARASARRDRTLALRLRAEPQPRLQYIKGKQLPPAREVTAPGPPEEGAHRAGVEQIGATRGLAEQVLLRVCVQPALEPVVQRRTEADLLADSRAPPQEWPTQSRGQGSGNGSPVQPLALAPHRHFVATRQ